MYSELLSDNPLAQLQALGVRLTMHPAFARPNCHVTPKSHKTHSGGRKLLKKITRKEVGEWLVTQKHARDEWEWKGGIHTSWQAVLAACG